MNAKPTYEHAIAKGNLLPKFRDTITLPSGVNLTGATFKFRYAKPGEAATERAASLVTGTAAPSLTAATSFDLEWGAIAADTANAGVFNYHWRIMLNGETAPLDVPTQVDPEADGSPRTFQRFEVVAVL